MAVAQDLEITEYSPSPDARLHLERLVGRTVYTISDRKPNTILRLDKEDVIVGTEKAPEGEPVPVAWVQIAVDRLWAARELRISTESLGRPIGSRSSFLGAVLTAMDGVVAETSPQRVRLSDKAASFSWGLRPGTSIRRRDVHARYGGGRQGGISASATSPNVLVFSYPVRERHGYIDGWRKDGCFHYTGEGQVGDQTLTRGNRAIAGHSENCHALRVFDGVAGEVTYVGEFELADDPPYYRTDAPESEDAPSKGTVVRQVLVFRLRPLDTEPQVSENVLDQLPEAAVTHIPVEQQRTEKTFVNPSGETYEVERREQRLVLAYKTHMAQKGSDVDRLLIRPTGEAKPLLNDVFDKTRNNLIEAKGSAARSEIRMAIGQLADYGRFVTPRPRLAVLVPARPRPDLEELLGSQGIGAIWPTKDGFEDNQQGHFS